MHLKHLRDAPWDDVRQVAVGREDARDWRGIGIEPLFINVAFCEVGEDDVE